MPDVLSEAGLDYRLDLIANKSTDSDQWANAVEEVRESHRALASQLNAERERREEAENALDDSHQPPPNAAIDHSPDVFCPACDYFAKYGDSC